MLIDTSHKKWFGFTLIAAALSLALDIWLDRTTPSGLTGGSSAGLGFGIAGSALMIFAGLLAAHRRFPTWWWIGPRRFWLKGHIWFGLLSVVLVLCHSSLRWGGPIEKLLWVVLGLTIGSGIFGLALQQFLPGLMTTRLSREVPYEQVPKLCQVLRREADVLAEKIGAVEVQVSQTNFMASQVGMGAKVQFQQFYETHVRPFLGDGELPPSFLANPIEAEQAFTRLRELPALARVGDELTQLQGLCEERRQLPQQERLHLLLHTWLLVHIPLSVLLLVLGVAHAVMALYY